MLCYDQDSRRQIAAERIERIADDYAKANAPRPRTLRLSLAAGLQLGSRAKGRAQLPQLEV
jgi:hypothetical protein